METEKAIRTRRSIRRFESNRIAGEDVEALLEAGRWAPSGLNNQPWKLVIVEDRDKASELAAYTKYASIVEGAPLLIAVFLDQEASYDRDKDIMAIGALIQNVLLAAHSRGLGAVWLGEILKEKERVGELLKTPPVNEMMALIAVGHPAEKPGDGSRKPASEIILGRF
jgi:nitroreductase